jgi:hypothetical protein
LKKETLLAVILLSLVVTLSIVTTSASATDNTKVGVKVGDTADYTYSISTPSGTLDTERYRIEILQIASTDVTIDLRSVYLNNSEGPDNIITGNVSSGDNPIFPYLIPANLGQGDYVDNLVMWVDNTTTMIVAGQYRTVNHFDMIISLPAIPAGVNWTWSNDVYYDKITGLLVKWNWTLAGYFSPYPNGTRISYIRTLTSTTAFTSPITVPLITTAGTAVVAITIVAAIATSHRKLKTTAN